MALEIIGGILSVLVAIGALIGYMTRTDVRIAFSTLVVLFDSFGELFYDLAVVLKNIKLVKKNTLPGIDPSYALEFGDNGDAVQSLKELPTDIHAVLAQLGELSKTIPKLGAIRLPK